MSRSRLTSATNPTFICLSCYGQGGNCSSTPPPSTCNQSATTVTNQQGSVNVATVPPSTLQTVSGRPTMVLVAGNTANESAWTDVAAGTLANRIRNGRTGATRLDLPLVSDGALPIDLIRRPSVATPDATVVLNQRFFKMASLRILLSDRAADITGLQTVTATTPVNLAQLATDSTYRSGLGVTWLNGVPMALAGDTAPPLATPTYRVPKGTPIADGYLKIERQDQSGVWSDVTSRSSTGGSRPEHREQRHVECAGHDLRFDANDPSPDAVIRFQRVRDNPAASPTNYSPCGHRTAARLPGRGRPRQGTTCRSRSTTPAKERDGMTRPTRGSTRILAA